MDWPTFSNIMPIGHPIMAALKGAVVAKCFGRRQVNEACRVNRSIYHQQELLDTPLLALSRCRSLNVVIHGAVILFVVLESIK